MFAHATSFNQPLNDWDVSIVTNMTEMFMGAESFNQPLNNWNLHAECNIDAMFEGADSFDFTNAPWLSKLPMEGEITIKRSVVQEGRDKPWWENAWSDVVLLEPFIAEENIVIFNGEENNKDHPSITNYIMKEKTYKTFMETQQQHKIPTTGEPITSVKLYKLVIEEDNGDKPEGVELSGGRRKSTRRKSTRKKSKRRKSTRRKSKRRKSKRRNKTTSFSKKH